MPADYREITAVWKDMGVLIHSTSFPYHILCLFFVKVEE